MNSKWNILADENGNTYAITAEEALHQYQCQLQQQAERNAATIKGLLQFVPVSNLRNTDLREFLKDSQPIYKDGINGIANLEDLAGEVAIERGITEPCLCFLDLDGKKYILANSRIDFIIINSAEVTKAYDYDYDLDSDDVNTPFGFMKTSAMTYFKKELDEPEDYDFRLKATRLLKDRVYCNYIDDSNKIGSEQCIGCDFYRICGRKPLIGTIYYYIKKCVRKEGDKAQL